METTLDLACTKIVYTGQSEFCTIYVITNQQTLTLQFTSTGAISSQIITINSNLNTLKTFVRNKINMLRTFIIK